MAKKSDLLIDDDDLLVLQTKLAVIIGDRRAIALQQIHYWMGINEKAKKTDHFFDDSWWVYNTWSEWHKSDFRFWSVPTIRRIFADLELEALIITRTHDDTQKGSWITINYGRLEEMLGVFEVTNRPRVRRHRGADQNDQGGLIKMIRGADQNDQGLGTTETNTETSTETTEDQETPPVGGDALSSKGSGDPVGNEDTLASVTVLNGMAPPTAHDLRHMAVEAALDVRTANYGLIEKWANFFMGTTPEYTTPRTKGEKPKRNGVFFEYQINPGMTIDEIGAFGRWYKQKSPGIDMPSACDKMNMQVAKFRADPAHDRLVERYRLDREAAAQIAAQGQHESEADQDEPIINDDQRQIAAATFASVIAKFKRGSQ